jgi:copper(I)-binding protein
MQRLLTMLLLLALIFTPILGVSAQDSPTLYITDAWVRPFVGDLTGTAHDAADDADDAHGHHHGADESTTDESGVLGRGTSAIYFNLTNTGAEDVTLISANTFAAYKTELHETTIDSNDVMIMQALHDGVVIPAGETVAFAPAGKHVMLIGLYGDIAEGSAVSLDLTFEDAAGETFTLHTAAPALSAAPAASDVVVLDGWVRTNFGAADDHGHMDHGSHDDAHTTETDDHSDHSDTHAAETPDFNSTSAVYLQLHNQGEDDTLIAVHSDVAETVELHETVIDSNDVMRMQALVGGIPLPNGETVTMSPGGLHIMLIQVHQALITGQAITVTLVYESGAEQVIAVPVRDVLGNPWQDHDTGH